MVETRLRCCKVTGRLRRSSDCHSTQQSSVVSVQQFQVISICRAVWRPTRPLGCQRPGGIAQLRQLSLKGEIGVCSDHSVHLSWFKPR